MTKAHTPMVQLKFALAIIVAVLFFSHGMGDRICLRYFNTEKECLSFCEKNCKDRGPYQAACSQSAVVVPFTIYQCCCIPNSNV
ncbi:hypothetical protein Lalb_Chr21g0309891 [Lupinus albus]|uniref:Knottin, scorpion toxin n=1 Tax=Lupinus albus TaxID=3870 RepID=A0A6A4NKV5_LUPAL|nr:hypothetical protein Lalb_Chr21g0309891 [Lupinus albus]